MNDLRRILSRYGVVENSSRGKGGHTYFQKGSLGYPIPNKRDVPRPYVAGVRKKFGLREADGTSDEDFYSH